MLVRRVRNSKIMAFFSKKRAHGFLTSAFVHWDAIGLAIGVGLDASVDEGQCFVRCWILRMKSERSER